MSHTREDELRLFKRIEETADYQHKIFEKIKKREKKEEDKKFHKLMR